MLHDVETTRGSVEDHASFNAQEHGGLRQELGDMVAGEVVHKGPGDQEGDEDVVELEHGRGAAEEKDVDQDATTVSVQNERRKEVSDLKNLFWKND